MRLRRAVVLALSLACGVAMGSGLQVSPVTLTLQPAQNAEGLWLSNTGDNVVQAQVRVYRWTQEGGEDKLTPSRNLLASPPMLQIAVADRQLIRVIRANAPAGAVEDAYRVIIDELPVQTEGRKGLQLVLRYSVPIFIAAASATPTAAQLTWAVRREGDQAVLEVANTGGSHAHLADLQFVDRADRRTELHPGLLGYVLPGSRMRWPLKAPAGTFASGGTLKTMINGNATQQSIPALEPAR